MNKKNVFIIFFFIVLGVLGIVALLKLKHTVVFENEAAKYGAQEVLLLPEPPGEIQEQEELSPPNPMLRIRNTGVGYLNVRDTGSLQGKLIGRVLPGSICEYTEKKNSWYHILVFEKNEQNIWSCERQTPSLEEKGGWVFGEYVQEVDRSKDLFQNKTKG